jgi:chromosome segregation ATPase
MVEGKTFRFMAFYGAEAAATRRTKRKPTRRDGPRRKRAETKATSPADTSRVLQGSEEAAQEQVAPETTVEECPAEACSGLVQAPAEAEWTSEQLETYNRFAKQIAVERRAQQRLKSRLFTTQKELDAAKRERESLERRASAARDFLQGDALPQRSKEELNNDLVDLDVTLEELDLQCKTVERELADAVTASGVGTSLVREVQSIRRADAAKSVRIWRQKVSAAEAELRELQRELESLKSLGASGAIEEHRSQSLQESRDESERVNNSILAYQAQLQKLQEQRHKELQHRRTQEHGEIAQQQQRSADLRRQVFLSHKTKQEKERDLEAVTAEVGELQTLLDQAQRLKVAALQEKQQLENHCRELEMKIQRTKQKTQEAVSSVNKILLQSSDAPIMQEKAWRQESAALDASRRQILERNRSLQAEITGLSNAKDKLQRDVDREAELIKKIADTEKKIEHLEVECSRIRGDSADANVSSSVSQKDQIIKDLEASIAAVKGKTSELLRVNKRLSAKLVEDAAILERHGFNL